MDIKTGSISSLPASALVAAIATGLLFISIPLLTKISTVKGERKKFTPVLINQYKPPPPPEPEQEKRLEELQKNKTPEKIPPEHKMPQPRLDIAASGLTAGTVGTIAVNGLLKSDIKVSNSRFVTALTADEVDQRATPVRTFQPRYPFEAQQKGLEGRVTVKFVVDSTGTPQEPEIVNVEPKEVEGVFDSAALECIKKFKYRPAVQGGKPVDSIAGILFTFSVTE